MWHSRSNFRLRGALPGQSVAPPSCPRQVRPGIFPYLPTPANLDQRCISCSGICRDGTNRATGFPVIQCCEYDASSVSIAASRSAAPPSFPMTCRIPTSLAATSSSGVLYKVNISIGVIGMALQISPPAWIPFPRGILKSKRI